MTAGQDGFPRCEFHVTDERLDGRAPFELALDGANDTAFLA